MAKMFIGNLELPEDGTNDEFAKRFNSVSKAFKWAYEKGISEEEHKRRFDIWSDMKYCLEQGLPIAEPHYEDYKKGGENG